MVKIGNLMITFEIHIDFEMLFSISLKSIYALDIYWTDYSKERLKEVKTLANILEVEW